MNGLILFGICFVTWLAWVPAVLMEKKARGDSGGTSILPVIPLFPLVGWGIGAGLNLIKPNAGLYIVGGLHAVLFAAFVGSVISSAVKIKMRKSRTSAWYSRSARSLRRGVLQGRMKRMQPATELMFWNVLAITLGVTCIVGGLIARQPTTDFRQMFTSGKWSLTAVKNTVGLHATTDFATDKERLLFGALGYTNEQCIILAQCCVYAAYLFVLIGTCLLMFGGRNILLARRITINSQNPTSDGIRQPADGSPKPSM